MSKLIFLSHIHEERQLALILKEAIEDEFSGFVDIFVSSDGVSIPAGSNFLKRIEKGLLDCNAAFFLISPKSINRNWINFELGAVWIKNKMNELSQGTEIPAIPICHSGMNLSALPQPINGLNSIQANLPAQLEFAFKSIQTSLGGRGRLKTDFVELSGKIINFERKYTIGDSLNSFVKTFTNDPSIIYTLIHNYPNSPKVEVSLGDIEDSSVKILKENAANVSDYVTLITNSLGMRVDTFGAKILTNVVIQFDSAIMREYESLIMGR